MLLVHRTRSTAHCGARSAPWSRANGNVRCFCGTMFILPSASFSSNIGTLIGLSYNGYYSWLGVMRPGFDSRQPDNYIWKNFSPYSPSSPASSSAQSSYITAPASTKRLSHTHQLKKWSSPLPDKKASHPGCFFMPSCVGENTCKRPMIQE